MVKYTIVLSLQYCQKWVHQLSSCGKWLGELLSLASLWQSCPRASDTLFSANPQSSQRTVCLLPFSGGLGFRIWTSCCVFHILCMLGVSKPLLSNHSYPSWQHSAICVGGGGNVIEGLFIEKTHSGSN